MEFNVSANQADQQQPIDQNIPEHNLPFANLPEVLRIGTGAFKTYHERMIFLYGAIATLSGLCTNVTGVYRQQKCFPNLFLFILAAAGTGKSTLTYAKKLILNIHKNVAENSKMEMELYKTLTKGKKLEVCEMPKPKMKVVTIPANCSSAKFIEHLMANEDDTPSVMVESEIDTLSIASKSEWGNFSDILRKAFHNEPVSYSRKRDDEFYEVLEPKLSIALSGTHNQYYKLIDNAEDGLVSRFLVFSFSAPPVWSDVSPCKGCINIDDIFRNLSTRVEGYYQYLQGKEIRVNLTEVQWEQINYFGQASLKECLEAENDAGMAIIKRHALMAFKICMTLTALRMAENDVADNDALCEDDDFLTAMYLVNESLQNSLDLLKGFSPSLQGGSRYKQEILLKMLPDEFTRELAISEGGKLSYAVRTVDRYLKQLCKEGKLKSTGYKVYHKL